MLNTLLAPEYVHRPRERLGHVVDVNIVPGDAAIAPNLDRLLRQGAMQKNADRALGRLGKLPPAVG